MKKILVIVLFFLKFRSSHADIKKQPGYGYVGPACAVVDGQLFIHGVAKRLLSEHESNIFRLYQEDISRYRSGMSSDLFIMDAPVVPNFCGGYDDSTEVVLSSCIVRNSHVYINEKLIRALTNKEKARLDTAITRNRLARNKRRIKKDAESAGTTPQKDFSALLHRILNVNSTVTSRFLPVVSQSPLFSLDGAFQTVLGNAATNTFLSNEPTVHINNQRQIDLFTTSTVLPTTVITKPPTTLPSSPSAVFKYNTPRVETTSQSFEMTREKSSFPHINRASKRFSSNTKKNKKVSKLSEEEISILTVHDEETVTDPRILQLIAKALANNEILDNIDLTEFGNASKMPPTNSKSIEITIPQVKPENIATTPKSTGKRLGKLPHEITNDIHITSGILLSLPNDICTAHLIDHLMPSEF